MPTSSASAFFLQDTAFYVALFMAVFAILFGTRHIDASERHEGMVAAIAFESVVKLVAFLAVGLFVTFGLYGGFGDIFARAEASAALSRLFTIDGVAQHTSWITLTLLAMGAIVVLPRQFQVMVVENVDERHLKKAMWLFPLYLLLINIFVLPIAFAGLLLFPQGGVDADTFVLTVPMKQQQPLLALIAFIGGLSAATGMIIVETVALATMVCNDLVMPLLLRVGRLHLSERRDLAGILLAIRRGTIILVVLLGYAYVRLIGESYALVTIGLVSFAAAMQFVPAIIGGIYWKGATKAGALAGLTGGFLRVDLYAAAAVLRALGLDRRELRREWSVRHCAAEAVCAVWVGGARSDRACHDLDHAGERRPLCRHFAVDLAVDHRAQPGGAVRRHLQAVDGSRAGLARPRDHRRSAGAARPLHRGGARERGASRVSSARTGGASTTRVRPTPRSSPISERQLAGAIGAASARIMVASVLREEMHDIDEVVQILDEASQLVVYSRQLEQKSRELEAATADLRAANERLKELDKMKDDFMATVSHEVRTPLTSIRSFSEILRDNPDLDADQRQEFISIIVQESERLSRLINDILDLAKMEAGTSDWHIANLAPKAVIEQALAATPACSPRRVISRSRPRSPTTSRRSAPMRTA